MYFQLYCGGSIVVWGFRGWIGTDNDWLRFWIDLNMWTYCDVTHFKMSKLEIDYWLQQHNDPKHMVRVTKESSSGDLKLHPNSMISTWLRICGIILRCKSLFKFLLPLICLSWYSCYDWMCTLFLMWNIHFVKFNFIRSQ